MFDNVAMYDNVDNADNVTRMSQEVKTRAPELSKLGEIKPLIVCPGAVPFTETAFVCRQNLISGTDCKNIYILLLHRLLLKTGRGEERLN